MVSPQASIAARAWARSSSSVQASAATPRIGQCSRPRRSSRYNDRNVMTRAKSPLIPKTTRTSVACSLLAPVRGRGLTAVLIPVTVLSRSETVVTLSG
jgi:hypothetical protein